jgi:hypothetical protein
VNDRLFRAGLVIVAVAAAASSFGSLRGLAIRAGGWGDLAPLLPLSLDTFAALSTRLWLANAPLTREARHWGRASALVAIGLSIAGNAVDHALSAGQIGVTWPLTVAVGAVPPALLGLVIHLAHVSARISDTAAHAQTAPAAATVTDPAPHDVPAPAVAEPVAHPAPRTDVPTDDDLLDDARAIVARYRASGRRVGAATLVRELRIGQPRSQRLWSAIQALEDAPRLRAVGSS